ncbi:MAG: uroporphyrinogen decarboxylase family protein, partial [Chloroflexota bacterium]|nr:uroporphyrinogen decarboxylase family protein [Chloroflexota bacterium]
DPQAYARLIIEANQDLDSPIVYVGSGYNNYLAAALGGRIKERELGAPDLTEPIIKQSADELDGLDVKMIEKDSWIQKIREAARLVSKEIGDTHMVAVTAWGPFTLAGQIYGVEQFMRASFKKPAEVEKTLEFATNLLMQFYRPMLEEKTISMASIADPTASGDLISGRVFEKFDLPYLQRLIASIKSYNVYAWLHICGNTTEKLNLIAQTGADCFSLDYKVNLQKAKEVLGGKMCIAGNIDPVMYLYNGTPQSVAEASAKCLADATAGGGFILTSGCDLPPTVKLENIQAMMRAGMA